VLAAIGKPDLAAAPQREFGYTLTFANDAQYRTFVMEAIVLGGPGGVNF
jgi:hypothetical protein